MSIDAAIAAKISGVKHVWHIREAIGGRVGAIVKFPLQNNKIFLKNYEFFKLEGNCQFTIYSFTC